jgi:phosphoserine phosphatase
MRTARFVSAIGPVTFVATLISSPAASSITDDVLAEARRILGTRHPTRVLHGEVAAEVLVEAEPARAQALEHELRTRFAGLPIDVAVLPSAHRRKRLFLADMDSTMIAQECIDELADYVGLRAEVAAITERAMRGEIAFEPALRERVALLRDLPLGVVDEILAQRITLMPGARTLVATMRANGAYACLVSGGFTLFTGPVAARIGFDEHRANRLVVADGRLAGQVEEPILGREAKLATLVDLRTRLGLLPEDTLAVGDGANDLAMIGEAGLGVAFRAKPAVAAVAGARIDHGDLTALLYLQGYAASEFVAA